MTLKILFSGFYCEHEATQRNIYCGIQLKGESVYICQLLAHLVIHRHDNGEQ